MRQADRRARWLLIAICLIAVQFTGGLASAAKVKVGSLSLTGPGTDIAINRIGAGGADPGDLYILNTGNKRVEVYTPGGTSATLTRAFGLNVVESGPGSNGTGYEICVPSAGDVCQVGSEAGSAGALASPQGIAVDEVNGIVYVADQNNRRIDAFSATGVFEGAFGWKVNAGTPDEKLQFCTVATGCQVGSTGANAGQLAQQIKGLAVDPVTHHVYLADQRNGRVDEYAPTLNGLGEVTGASFVRAFGWDVVSSGPDDANEIAAVAVSATVGTFKLTFTPTVGSPQTTGDLAFNAPASGGVGPTASVQNALEALSSVGAGNVKVTGGPGNASGSKPYGITFTGALGGKANGGIAAANGATPLSGGTATEALKVTTMNTGGGAGFEICTTADVCKAGATGTGAGQFAQAAAGGSARSVAVDSNGSIYVVDRPGNSCSVTLLCRMEKFDAATLLEADVSPADLTVTGASPEAKPVWAAIDPSNDHPLVLKQLAAGEFRVLEFDASGAKVDVAPPQSQNPLTGGGQIAVGSNERVYVLANAQVTFLGPVPAPSAEILSADEVSDTKATLRGKVTVPAPGGEGFNTTYHFEYSADNGLNWSKAPTEDASVGSGAGTVAVSQKVEGLQPGLTYIYRLVATTGPSVTSTTSNFTTGAAAPSISGMTAEEVMQTSVKLVGFVNPNNEATSYRFEWGPDASYGHGVPAEFEAFAGSGGKPVKVSANISALQESSAYHFRIVATNSAGTTKGSDAEVLTLNVAGLPEGRGYELVSPPDKRPQGDVSNISNSGVTFQAAADGQSLLYPIQQGLSDSTTGGEVRYLATRGGMGWQSVQASPPSLTSSTTGSFADVPSYVSYYSSDLSCGVVESASPLTSDTPQADLELGVTNLYRRNSNGSFTLLSKTVPSNPNLFLEDTLYKVAGASADCGRIFFATRYRLLPGGSGLYEWDHGILRDAGLRPDDSTGVNAQFGAIGATESQLNSVSLTGRAFFSAVSNQGGDSGKDAVFVRKAPGTVVDASQKQGGASDNTGAVYRVASPDGTHVFFGANPGLTSTPSDGERDLYDYNVDTGILRDLSANTNPANAKGAAVRGLVATSSDGSYVYFAALGRLVGEGRSEEHTSELQSRI